MNEPSSQTEGDTSVRPQQTERETAHRTIRRELLTKGTVALFVVVLLYSRQIGIFFDGDNRSFLLWEFQDNLAIVLGVVLLAAAATAVSLALRTTKRRLPEHLFNHLFLYVLMLGLLTLQPFDPDEPDAVPVWNWRPAAHGLALLAICVSLVWQRFRLVQYATVFCLIFSPFVAILFFQTLTLEPCYTGEEQPPDFAVPTAVAGSDPTPRKTAGGIYYFVFDAWSYVRSTSNGRFLPELPNLRRLADQSLFCLDGRSPDDDTLGSLPAIVHQAETNGQSWQPFGPGEPPAKTETIFQRAHRHGHRTALIGFYLPYRHILGDQLDYCFSVTHDPKGSNFFERIAISAERNLEYLEDPLCQSLYRYIDPRLFGRHWHAINQRTLAETLALIESWPHNTLALFHWPCPHWPFVLNPDGTYYEYPDFGPDGEIPSDPPGYQRQLVYLDFLIGQIVQTLKSAGKFDNALLVLTADHAATAPGWHDEQMQHVPLVIKAPGQTSPVVVDAPLANNQLGPLIDSALAGTLNEETLLRLLPDASKDSQFEATTD
jgi:hypothetical protein